MKRSFTVVFRPHFTADFLLQNWKTAFIILKFSLSFAAFHYYGRGMSSVVGIYPIASRANSTGRKGNYEPEIWSEIEPRDYSLG